jgi:hypothetical protein
MKKILFIALLIFMGSIAASSKSAVAKGQTHTALGDYRIEKAVAKVDIEGVPCKAYKISYKNSPMEVTVIVRKESKSRKYYVLSDKLNIEYAWNKHYFGVKRLGNELKKMGYVTSDENLNRVEYFNQRVLGPGLLPDRESAMMVAAFFPLLLADNPLIVASR